MSWTLAQMQSLIDTMSNDRKKTQLEWNKKFPPNMEVDVPDEETGITTTYEIWKVHDGNIFIIPRSKNGYQPERRINIDKKIVGAIKNLKE